MCVCVDQRLMSFFPLFISILFFEAVFWWMWRLSFWLGWQATTLGYPALPTSVTVTGAHHHVGVYLATRGLCLWVAGALPTDPLPQPKNYLRKSKNNHIPHLPHWKEVTSFLHCKVYFKVSVTRIYSCNRSTQGAEVGSSMLSFTVTKTKINNNLNTQTWV